MNHPASSSTSRRPGGPSEDDHSPEKLWKSLASLHLHQADHFQPDNVVNYSSDSEVSTSASTEVESLTDTDSEVGFTSASTEIESLDIDFEDVDEGQLVLQGILDQWAMNREYEVKSRKEDPLSPPKCQLSAPPPPPVQPGQVLFKNGEIMPMLSIDDLRYLKPSPSKRESSPVSSSDEEYSDSEVESVYSSPPSLSPQRTPPEEPSTSKGKRLRRQRNEDDPKPPVLHPMGPPPKGILRRYPCPRKCGIVIKYKWNLRRHLERCAKRKKNLVKLIR